jgi:ABC-type bacteriocin/lantibiotic exporter with double-glycine peptidase domain/CRP-like cAMP-binding protein
VRLEPADLADFEDPAILHWDMNHFVVCERWTPKGVWIVDPADGRRFVPTDVFDESFTGICVLFEIGDDFEERPREPVSAGRYLALLRGAGSALAMVLFASLAIDVLATVVPLTTQVAIDQVIGRHRVDWLFIVGSSAAAFVTFSALWSLVRGSLLVRVRARLDVAITQQFVGHLLALPVAFFGQRTVADLMARVQANRTIREMLAGESVGLLADGVMLLAYLALMFAFDASLSWIVLAAGLAYVGVFLLGRPIIRAGADEIQRAEILAGSALLQILRGITTIKSAGVERTSRTRWLNAWIASLNANAKNALKQQTVQTFLFAVRMIVPIVVLFVGGRRVLDGELTPGRLVAFQMLQAGFLMPLQGVIRALLGLQMIPVLLGRMDDVLLSEREPSRSVKCPRLEGAIELRNVTFSYSPTSPPVLEDVSLRIEPGQKVAFVGPSGSGKSTIARLLLGLYEPTEGEVLLDENDLATLDLTSVRRQYGVVLQETALFDGTIADNLRLFHPTAPQEHLVQAARVAQIHDDIIALPRGYETRISSSAGVLSGGQRQRLALARAIVHRPPIMILDEATSALDAVTEGAIERYLTTRACTRVVIAHRLSTVRDADTIFVVDQGQIVERGRHAELVAAGGLYARLVAGEHQPRALSDIPPERQPITLDELAPFDVLRGWSKDEKRELAEELQRADFPEDTRVVEQDARATGLYLIVEGTVAIELAEPGLAAWTVAELGAGSIFGEAGLLDGSPSSASVVARTPVRLLHLPYGPFQELLRRGDVLAARAMLSLGAIVAERMRDAVRRREELATGEERRHEAEPNVSTGAARGRRELPLGETLLGAALDPDEVEALERMASRVVVRAGESLFERDTEADTLFVLRSGSVALQTEAMGTVSVVDAGAILGETSAFDGAPHVMSAVALEEVAATALGREALVELLLSGKRVARKLLAALSETLARRFRLANYRLREAVALERGEVDRAHAAREQALEAAREERDALGASGDGPLPVVRVKSPEQSGAACLTARLRASGRPASMPAVIEALAAVDDGLTRALPEVARSFGLECRKLEVPLRELRALDAPILALAAGDGAFVLEAYGASGFRVMDPLRGRLTVSDDELAAVFGGTAFEVRDPSVVPVSASLPHRVALFARSRLADIGRLLAITLALQAVVMGMSLATALAVQRVFPLADRPLLGVVVAAPAALGVGYTVMQQLQGRAIEHLRAHLDRELLDQLMTHILKLPIAFFDRFPPGEVLQRFQAFANVRSLFSTQGVAVLLSVASLVVASVLLVSFAPHLFFVVVLVLLLYAAVTAFLFPMLRRIATDEVAARGRQQDRLIEILQGVTTLRMAGDANVAEQRWFPAFLDELSASLRRDRTFAVVTPALDWVRGLAVVICVWLGTRNVLDGALSIGALVGFLAVFATFLESVNSLAVQIVSSAPSLVDYGLVRATFAEPLEQSSGATLLSPGQLRGRIALEQVSFRYTADGPLVLRDVSLQIESGMKVALVGASGSGKSTLGRLLLGLYLPSAGRILFDGKDVSSLDLEALRRRMGVVLQEPFLLPGTIRENIALGAEGATLERVAEAAHRAAIADDIERMPMGYETIVAEGGSSFSGGQRQRLVIARALVSSPAILLLDEATSALDNFSQAIIERHLAHSTSTRIVIAHRLSTVVDADLIVVLHKGSIVEQGTHQELLAKRGAYHELVRAQVGTGEEGSAT